jgi:hypothetical protein
MVQELRGGEAVLRTGELEALILEEKQQTSLHGKQSAGQGRGWAWVSRSR